jgi:hypothetical protein
MSKATDAYGSVAAFFTDLLGIDWQALVPSTWTSQNFSWDNLTTLDYETAINEYLAEKNIDTNPESIKDVYQSLAAIETELCTPEEFIPSEKVPATCSGPSLSVAYVPKACIMEPTTKVAVCDPARLVLTKTPGECTLKYKSATEWTAKECKIEKDFGPTKEIVLGGRNYTVPLGDVMLEKKKNRDVRKPIDVTTNTLLSGTTSWYVDWTDGTVRVPKETYTLKCVAKDAANGCKATAVKETTGILRGTQSGQVDGLPIGFAYDCYVIAVNKADSVCSDKVAFTTYPLCGINNSASVEALWVNDFSISTDGWVPRAGSALQRVDHNPPPNFPPGSFKGLLAGPTALPITSGNGPFTRFRPSTVADPLVNTFPASGQLVTQLAIYLDVDADFDNDSRFDWDVNLNKKGPGPSPAFLRDYIFSVGFYNDASPPGANTNRFIVSASNNAPGNPRNPGRNPIAISTSGWYIFQHRFYAGSCTVGPAENCVFADLKIFSTDNNGDCGEQVTDAAWTLSSGGIGDSLRAEDDILDTGGVRIGWLYYSQLPELYVDFTYYGIQQSIA